jgi:hypothetical protein
LETLQTLVALPSKQKVAYCKLFHPAPLFQLFLSTSSRQVPPGKKQDLHLESIRLFPSILKVSDSKDSGRSPLAPGAVYLSSHEKPHLLEIMDEETLNREL